MHQHLKNRGPRRRREKEKSEKYCTNEGTTTKKNPNKWRGKLPEKEFRIMIVKMIKNLENKNGENARIN